MALITCPGCGNKVSDKAMYCPKCGRKINISGKVCMECGTVLMENEKEYALSGFNYPVPCITCQTEETNVYL